MRQNWNFIHLFSHVYCWLLFARCAMPWRKKYVKESSGGKHRKVMHTGMQKKNIRAKHYEANGWEYTEKKNRNLTKTMQTTIITPNGLHKDSYVLHMLGTPYSQIRPFLQRNLRWRFIHNSKIKKNTNIIEREHWRKREKERGRKKKQKNPTNLPNSKCINYADKAIWNLTYINVTQTNKKIKGNTKYQAST